MLDALVRRGDWSGAARCRRRTATGIRSGATLRAAPPSSCSSGTPPPCRSPRTGAPAWYRMGADQHALPTRHEPTLARTAPVQPKVTAPAFAAQGTVAHHRVLRLGLGLPNVTWCLWARRPSRASARPLLRLRKHALYMSCAWLANRLKDTFWAQAAP